MEMLGNQGVISELTVNCGSLWCRSTRLHCFQHTQRQSSNTRVVMKRSTYTVSSGVGRRVPGGSSFS
eukprot:9477155-Pyramimonas_sp.AAC.1